MPYFIADEIRDEFLTLENTIEEQKEEVESLRKKLTLVQAVAIERENEIKRLQGLLLEAGLGTYI